MVVMKTTERRDNAIRYSLGAAGFLVLAGGTPCVLAMYDNTQSGLEDPVGMFGVVGLGALVLFVGSWLLYKAVTRDDS